MRRSFPEYESVETWHQKRIEEHEEKNTNLSPPSSEYVTFQLNDEQYAASLRAIADRKGAFEADKAIGGDENAKEVFTDAMEEALENPEETVEWVSKHSSWENIRGSVVRITDTPIEEEWDNVDTELVEVDDAQ